LSVVVFPPKSPASMRRVPLASAWVPLPIANIAAAVRDMPESALKDKAVPVGNCNEFVKVAAFVIVPATAGALRQADPLLAPGMHAVFAAGATVVEPLPQHT